MENRNNLFSSILWIGTLLSVSIVLLLFESDQLWKIQQNNLFLYSWLYFKQQMVVAGGLLSYLGSFFTQFFCYPWMGVVLLCGWWLLLMWLIKRTFCVPARWSILTLIPIAILLVANMQLGNWIYVMRLPGYFFVPTIGTTLGVALLGVFRKLSVKLWVRMGYVVLVVVTGYPLIGVYALVSVLLMAVWIWRLSSNRQHNLLVAITTLLSVVVVPLLFYYFVYVQINIVDIYFMGIPKFPFDDGYLRHLIPYCLLVVYFLSIIIVRSQYNPSPILRWDVQGVLLAVLVIGVWYFWCKDENFHHELRMQHCIEHADWEGVIEEGKKQHAEPTRAIVMMRNLALSRVGRQCDEMYNFPKGAKQNNTTFPLQTFHKVGRLINYQYGLMNECYRFCMEEAVGLGWSVELLQYMARTAILGNESKTAKKYLRLLRNTHFYSDWANHMESLLNDRKLMENDKETGLITHMMQYEDVQSEGDGYVEKNLMTMLSKMDSDDPYFQEQAVLAAMWTKNIDDFWQRFDKYAQLYQIIHPEQDMPRIVQEALYLFSNFEQLPFINDLPFSQEVMDSFDGFMNLMQQCQGKPDDSMKDFIYQQYGHTYYYEYFFQGDITYE